MAIFLLSRPKRLTPDEMKRLPKGTVATDGAGGVVARAEVDLPLGGLLGYAVALGRAVPDAMFSVEDLPVVDPVGVAPADVAGSAASPAAAGAPAGAPAGTPAGTPAAAPASAPAAPEAAPEAGEGVITETDPWKLVDALQREQAERVFAAGNGLDAPGRDRCRRLLASGDPAEVAFGCRVARVTNWKSIVVTLRGLLRHDHPEVRREAVEAIGALAGPSMAGAVRPLTADPDAEVKAAAGVALARLG